MMDIDLLAKTVQTNCHISDAQYAGHYSLCTFLLKMREYYRWEKRIPLSHILAKSDVGAWISQRESDWENFESLSFDELEFNGQKFNPFQDDQINASINPHGYVYSGGYGIFGKPCFFLGELTEKQQLDKLTVFISEREMARDLAAPPAMIVGNTIYIRRESLRRYLWEKIEEWKWKHDPDTPMGRTLDFYKNKLNTQDFEVILDAMCKNETRSTMYHEIGEAKASELLGDQWRNLLAELPRSELELKLRAIKDHLADSITTLPSLIEEKNLAALHFYFANMTGMRKEIFPEALDAYKSWLKSARLSPLINLYENSYNKWLTLAHKIIAVYQGNPGAWRQEIAKLVD